MRLLNPGLEAHLASRCTTLCHCWRLERKDGVSFAFTDHDQPLTFGGLTYEAASGFTATAIEDQAGLATSNLDVQGILRSEVITEADINAGRYDAAEVTIWRVNWTDPSQRVEMRVGDIGQITRGKVAFTAEMRGLAARLEQVAGRIYQRTCPWRLGDDRCKVDLGAAGNHGSGVVVDVEDAFSFTASGIASFPAGRFAYGRLTWLTGADAGLDIDLAGHALVGDEALLILTLPMGAPVAAGDTFNVTAGCDGAFETCVDTYANAVNFGGFPHMPGDDFALTYATQGAENSGERRQGAGHL